MTASVDFLPLPPSLAVDHLAPDQFRSRFDWSRLAQRPISTDGLLDAAARCESLALLSEEQRRAAFDALALPELGMTLDAIGISALPSAALVAEAFVSHCARTGQPSDSAVLCGGLSWIVSKAWASYFEQSELSARCRVEALPTGPMVKKLLSAPAAGGGIHGPTLIIVDRAADTPLELLDAIFRCCEQNAHPVRVLLIDEFSGLRRSMPFDSDGIMSEMSALAGFRVARAERAPG